MLAAQPGPNVSTVHVLEIATEDADDQAKALTTALRGRIKASPDFALAEGDQSLSVLLLALKCGDIPDTNCQNKLAERLNTDRYIWGLMKKEGGQVKADLHFYQKGQPDVRQQFTYGDNLTEPLDPALQRLAQQMVDKLTKFGKVGTIKVIAERSINGDLFVDGNAVGRFSDGQVELTLPIGDHKFEVRAGGKLLAEGTAKVSATETLEAPLKAFSKAEQNDQKDASSSGWKKPVGYAALGVGGLMIAGGVFSMLKVNSINNDDGFAAYRKGFGSNRDICQAANDGVVSKAPGAASPSEVADFCSSGKTFSTLQFILLPVGVIAAGAGAYLAFSGDSKPSEGPAPAAARPRFQVIPAVGQRSGSVDVHVSF